MKVGDTVWFEYVIIKNECFWALHTMRRGAEGKETSEDSIYWNKATILSINENKVTINYPYRNVFTTDILEKEHIHTVPQGHRYVPWLKKEDQYQFPINSLEKKNRFANLELD